MWNSPYSNHKTKKLHNLQETTTVNDVAKCPQICVVLEDRHDENQETMVDIEGMLFNKSISICIDLGASQNYVSFQVVEVVQLVKTKHKWAWLVQLEIGTKIKVTKFVKACSLDLNGYLNKAYKNIQPLKTYNVLIGMDWLEIHKIGLDYFNKKLRCTYGTEKLKIVVRFPSEISVQKLFTMKVKKCV